MDKLGLSQENKAELFRVAKELANGKILFSEEEFDEFSKKVASRMKFVVHIETVKRYLSYQFFTKSEIKGENEIDDNCTFFTDMFNSFRDAWKNDRAEFIIYILFIILLFVFLWGGLWFIAIIEGRV